mmetsp:Transcript_6282/g.12410  ORF Transcript_6282/g.12410 Transcript_6282/m.12410 type:complete len:116 (-) Transcript_6282:66-413(-)
MYTMILKLLCWILEFLMDPEELRECNECLGYADIHLSDHIDSGCINEIIQKRRNHAKNSVHEWYESYRNKIMPPLSPTKVTWANNPISSTITIDIIDGELFQDAHTCAHDRPFDE